MEVDMTRSILVAAIALATVSLGARNVEAAEAPWCAVISFGTGSAYWDCQYRSFDDCYRRGNILAGNRGFCNPSPYYVPSATEQGRPAKRRARPQ